MTYVMETELVEKINAQRAEAIEFSKKPGCWMGMYIEPSDTKYWSERVPSGTLKEFDRINLEEDAYYTVADAYSKVAPSTLPTIPVSVMVSLASVAKLPMGT